MSETLSARAYGRHRGVSHVAVLKALREGRITSNDDGSIDPAKADAAWAANTRPRPKRGNATPTVAESTRVLLALKAARERLKLRQERGRLVRADEVCHWATATARRTKDQLFAMVPRLSAAVLGLTNLAEVTALLEGEVRRICEENARGLGRAAERRADENVARPLARPRPTGQAENADDESEG